MPFVNADALAPPDLDAQDSLGFPIIDDGAHLRRAHAQAPHERFLRRPGATTRHELLATLGDRPEWREDAIVARFNHEIRPQLDASELVVAPLLEIGGEHRIPAALWERLRANFAA